MSVNKLSSALSLGKQTAKGTPAPAPLYRTPLKGGNPFNPEITVTIDEETGQDWASNAFREKVTIAGDVSLRGRAKLLGLLLLGALGIDTVTGEAAPYTHTFSAGPQTPWYTLWSELEQEIVQIQDARVESLTISFSENQPLEISVNYQAMGAKRIASIPVGGEDISADPMFTPAAGTFLASGYDANPVPVRIKQFSLEIARNPQVDHFSGSVLPGDIGLGRATFKPQITIVPEENMDDFWAMASGDPKGTDIVETMVTGAFDFTLKIDEGVTLQLKADSVPWSTSYPEADPSGGNAEIEYSADDMLGKGKSPIEIVLKNDVASY